MLTFRDMTLDDRDTVLPMVDAFYRSNAVDHPVPREIVERSFLAAAGNEPLLRGTLIFEEGRLAGYLYVTLCYSAEVGGVPWPRPGPAGPGVDLYPVPGQPPLPSGGHPDEPGGRPSV